MSSPTVASSPIAIPVDDDEVDEEEEEEMGYADTFADYMPAKGFCFIIDISLLFS